MGRGIFAARAAASLALLAACGQPPPGRGAGEAATTAGGPARDADRILRLVPQPAGK